MSATRAPDCAGQCEGDAFDVQIGNEAFAFRKVRFNDRKVTGAQVAEAVGAHPVEEFVVLRQLPTRELETLRPTELSAIEPGARFFVIRGDGTDRIHARRFGNGVAAQVD